MSLTPEELSLRGKAGAHASWANTSDRSARTHRARSAFEARFERQVDPDGTMTPEARAKAAESARKAYFASLAFKSAQARRLRSQLRAAGESETAGR